MDERLAVHADLGSKGIAMRYTHLSAYAGATPAVGRAGGAYDNALAESVIDLHTPEPVHRRGPWRRFDDVEHVTLVWIACFNTQRIAETPASFSTTAFEEPLYPA